VFNQGSFIFGVSLTSPIDASIITTSLPILTLILSAFFLKEPVTGRKITGIVFGATGAILLVFGGQQVSAGNGSNIWGDLLILTAQLSFSIYLIFFRGLIGRYSPITIMKWMFTGSSLSLLPFTWDKMLATDWAALEWHFIAGIVFVVAGGTFISYLLMSVGQKRLRPTAVSIYNYVQPMAASVVAVMWGMDSFTLMKTVAVAFIFAGVFLVTQNRNHL
jgi:drug/metabolite transporter (DMT)-like permease